MLMSVLIAVAISLFKTPNNYSRSNISIQVIVAVVTSLFKTPSNYSRSNISIQNSESSHILPSPQPKSFDL